MKEEYEKKRKDLKYYSKSLEIIEKIKNDNNSKSIIDIGGWAGGFISRTSLETKVCLDRISKDEETIEGVELIIEDFLKWDVKRFDIVCCMQVLEHIDDENVEKFAEKLFSISDHVVISVPYKWPKNYCKYHKQDPVDEYKLKMWTKREPTESYIIKDGRVSRIICYYKL